MLQSFDAQRIRALFLEWNKVYGPGVPCIMNCFCSHETIVFQLFYIRDVDCKSLSFSFSIFRLFCLSNKFCYIF